MEYRHDLAEWRRKKTGESYDTLAERCGLSKSTIWQFVEGKANPTASSITGIFKALGLNPKFALDFEIEEHQFRRAVVSKAAGR